MKAYIITILHNENSKKFSDICLNSILNTESKLDPITFDATTPDTLFSVNWTWPVTKKKTCPHTGMTLKAYKNADINKRIACAQSHYRLWQKCVELNETICILEHDAIFIRKFEPFDFEGGVLALNSPIKATFMSAEYDAALTEGVNDIPYITDLNKPQGLPGNSAYVIKPWAAQELIDKQHEIGWWPNDAIMCRQLFPWLKIVKPYYAQVQDIKSTTRN
jgi:glycosyl transferase family 25